MSQITLYDLPSKGRTSCWSLNPWKIRLALNYKELDYKTHWVEYPDIAKTLSPHVPPNPKDPGSAVYTAYTIPTVEFPDGTWVMDSKNIAKRLEQDHPSSPPLYLDDPALAEVEKILPTCMKALTGVLMPRIPTNLLNEASREYFERTRAERFGKPLSVLMAEDGGEEAWVEALPGIKGLGEVVKRKGGPFILGEKVSYADFVIVGWLHFLRVIEEELHGKVVSIEPALGGLYDACKQWLERDGH